MKLTIALLLVASTAHADDARNTAEAGWKALAAPDISDDIKGHHAFVFP